MYFIELPKLSWLAKPGHISSNIDASTSLGHRELIRQPQARCLFTHHARLLPEDQPTSLHQLSKNRGISSTSTRLAAREVQKRGEKKMARNCIRNDELHDDEHDEEADVFSVPGEDASLLRGGRAASRDEQLNQLEVRSSAIFAACLCSLVRVLKKERPCHGLLRAQWSRLGTPSTHTSVCTWRESRARRNRRQEQVGCCFIPAELD